MPSPISPELQSKLAVWREKAAQGTLSMEEMKEAIGFLRADRRAAATQSKSSRTAKAKAQIPAAEDLLKDLGL